MASALTLPLAPGPPQRLSVLDIEIPKADHGRLIMQHSGKVACFQLPGQAPAFLDACISVDPISGKDWHTILSVRSSDPDLSARLEMQLRLRPRHGQRTSETVDHLRECTIDELSQGPSCWSKGLESLLESYMKAYFPQAKYLGMVNAADATGTNLTPEEGLTACIAGHEVKGECSTVKVSLTASYSNASNSWEVWHTCLPVSITTPPNDVASMQADLDTLFSYQPKVDTTELQGDQAMVALADGLKSRLEGLIQFLSTDDQSD